MREHFEALQNYKDFSPTMFDSKGLNGDGIECYKVVSSVNRDSDILQRCNWKYITEILPENNETIQIHRFRHWGCGWFDLLLVSPTANEETLNIVEKILTDLSDYPILDEDKYCEMQIEEANYIWKECFNVSERIEYIREHRGDINFYSFKDLRAIIRGDYFSGDFSELLSQ